MKGKGKLVDLHNSEINSINQLLHSQGTPPLQSKTVTMYDRAIVRRQLVYAQTNSRVKKRNSFTIKFVTKSSEYGIVNKFVSVSSAASESKYDLACIIIPLLE